MLTSGVSILFCHRSVSSDEIDGRFRSRARRGEAGVTTMVVLVNLKEDVGAEEYERWAQETYAPAMKALPSVRDWRAYRERSLLTSDEAPPYRYVVTVDIDNLAQT